MRLDSLRRTIGEFRYFKKILSVYGSSLLTGRYRLFPGMRALVADNPTSIQSATPYFMKTKTGGKTGALLQRINQCGYYRNTQKGEGPLYEAVYTANNYDAVREIKLFSFERHEILTVCVDAAARRRQLDEYEQLHTCFGMPRVTETDAFPHAYIIDQIRLTNRADEAAALCDIAQCTAAYCTAHAHSVTSVPVKEIVRFDYARAELREPLAWLAAQICPSYLSDQTALCLQHGDLSRDNLLYGVCGDTTRFWWIDWEHAGQRPFYYDYFFYMLHTAVCYGDTTALRLYLDGTCQEQTEALFAAVGLTYDHALRKDYFLAFAVAFLKERVCDFDRVGALNMYVEHIRTWVVDEKWS